MKIPVSIEVDGSEELGYQCSTYCPFKDEYNKKCTLSNQNIREMWCNGQLDGYDICSGCYNFIRQNNGE